MNTRRLVAILTAIATICTLLVEIIDPGSTRDAVAPPAAPTAQVAPAVPGALARPEHGETKDALENTKEVVKIALKGSGIALQNGRIPASELARIYHPTLRVKLVKPAAAAFNTMVLRATLRKATVPYVTGSLSAYRDLAGQVLLREQWCAAGACANAAVPGYSNHGWGIAIDLANPALMRPWIDRYGAYFGWSKAWSDAPWEAWHLRWRSGVWTERPDPGPNPTVPRLTIGSGGHGQAYYVRQVQRAVGVRADGEFGPATGRALVKYKREHRLAKDPRPIVTPRTWAKIRAPRPAKPPVPRPKPKPVEPAKPPKPVPATCVDVSKWQGEIDWQKVRDAGVRCAIPKVSEGADYVDPSWGPGRVTSIRQAGLILGGYHYARPKPGRDPALEARHFVATAKAGGWDAKRDLPLHIDLEETALGWCETASYTVALAGEIKRLSGRAPLLYSYPGFLNQIPEACRNELGRLRLHIAHYRVTAPLIPQPWASRKRPYVAWQYDDSARIPGIDTRVDVNTIAGGLAALEKLAGR